MNKLYIIGNLTSDPSQREVSSANGTIHVATFTVAVNERRGGESKATFFRVTAWRGLADICMKYIRKGSKVAVSGSVSVSVYKTQQGEARANLEVNADDIEFLTSRQQGDADDSEFVNAPQPVENDPDLPF